MDFQELVLTRRTVQTYNSEPVDEAVVEEALRLSLWSPNHKLTYPWKFYWVGSQSRQKLADLMVEVKSKKGPLNEIQATAARKKVLEPAQLIVLGIRRSEDAHRQHEDYATLAGSVLIASLSLWHKGIGSKWSTGGFSQHEKTYGILGVDPKEVSLEGCLMIGRMNGIPPAPERPDLAEFLVRVD